MSKIWRPSFSEYHADPAVGSTMLGKFREHPALFHGLYVSKEIESEPPDREMRLGTLLHHAVAGLEPTESPFGLEAVARKHFSDVVQVVQVDGRGAKKFTDAVAGADDPDLVCTRPDAEIVVGALASLLRAGTPMSALAKWLLVDCPGEREYSHRWEHPSGETCKVRYDVLPEIGQGLPGVRHCFTDLKFVNNVDLDAFTRNSANFGRHCQGALYSLGYVNLRPAMENEPLPTIGEETGEEPGAPSSWPLVAYVIIGNAPPHPIMVAYLSESFIEIGLDEVQRNLSDLANCRATEEWSTAAERSDEIPELEPPSWLLKEHERRIR